MKFEKEIKLKNGKNILIRNAEKSDAEEMLVKFKLMHSQTDMLLSYPEECNDSVDDEAAFLKSKCESPNEIELAAIYDGKIVGMAGISKIGDKYKVRHRAEFGISVLKEYSGLGIGSALTDACIESAKIAGYLQLELSVVANNETAINLYTNKGFIEYGRNPRGFNSKYSGFQEMILMRLVL